MENIVGPGIETGSEMAVDVRHVMSLPRRAKTMKQNRSGEPDTCSGPVLYSGIGPTPVQRSRDQVADSVQKRP
jgi:hypothetical protein